MNILHICPGQPSNLAHADALSLGHKDDPKVHLEDYSTYVVHPIHDGKVTAFGRARYWALWFDGLFFTHSINPTVDVHEGYIFTLSTFTIELPSSTTPIVGVDAKDYLSDLYDTCLYCGTTGSESIFHPGHCGECGATLPIIRQRGGMADTPISKVGAPGRESSTLSAGTERNTWNLRSLMKSVFTKV